MVVISLSLRPDQRHQVRRVGRRDASLSAIAGSPGKTCP